MPFGIRRKLFLAFALTAGLVVAALLLWHAWSFHHGFLVYVNESEAARLDALREDIENGYAEAGSWAFVDSRQSWLPHLFLRAGDEPVGADGPRPHNRLPFRDSSGRHERHGPGPRLSLRDADGRLLAGAPGHRPHSVRREITHDGKVVGYLELAPVEALSDAADVQFAAQQRDAFYFAAIAILVVAAGAAAIFSRNLAAPIGELTDGTRALALGQYETRIDLSRGDELGALAGHFNALAATLERNREARKQWVADISHELRTPISILRAELEALEDGIRALDPAAVRSLSAEVARLASLVDDLYELARSDAGALTYRKEVLELGALLEGTIASFRERFAAAAVIVELSADEPARVLADDDRLRQLFANLLENSLRYTNAGGRVRIEQRVVGERARVIVEDSAPGVPDAALLRLFDRLYRVDPSRSRETGAAGLGLAICASIVAAHDGTIVARHSSLGGLAIDVELPLHAHG